MEQAVLDLIVDRLNRIEKQNDDQLKLLHEHLEKDGEYYITVNKHETYFKGVWVALAAIIPAVCSYLATKFGLK